MKITYKQIHKLLDKGVNIKVDTPNGVKQIKNKFIKNIEGKLIYYSDGTYTNCAISHYMMFNNKMLAANELNVGYVCTHSNKIITKIENVGKQDYYDFEIDHESGLYYQNNTIHHNSGKSVIIGLIADFLRSKGKTGLILVPSISLTTQLHNDFKDYNLHDLYNSTTLIGGDNKEKILSKHCTISTWQSAMRMKDQMKAIDYIIIDEAQGLKMDTQSADIVYKCTNAKYRIGLTGTLPEDPTAKMSILGCVGVPKRYIGTQGLIERGLATPVQINMITFRYDNQTCKLFREEKGYAKQLVFLKENKNRNNFMSRMAIKTSEVGNTVMMCSHVQHMKDIFIELMKIKHPDVEVKEKDITGAKAFEFQDKYGIYFISGSTKASERTKIINILKGHSDCILVSNFQLFSTGINAKGITNIFFASPMKSYVTITQSIGRAIRTHVSKDTAYIYDFVDDFSIKGGSGPFIKQSEARIKNSYEPEGFPITKRTVTIEGLL